MSGAFGWAKNTGVGNAGGTTFRGAQTDFADAKRAYGSPRQVTIGQDSVDNAASVVFDSGGVAKDRDLDAFATRVGKAIPGAKHTLQSVAANVVMVVLDVTGSMGVWPREIFKRLPLLYAELCAQLSSDDVEILFIAHGDARTDRYPIQVTRFGKGPELDAMLASLEIEGNGGGQGTESHELVAYYLVSRVDTSTAQNVFTIFVTDEAACDTVDQRHIREYLGVSAPREKPETAKAFALLSRKSSVFTILCKTGWYDADKIFQWWQNILGAERVLRLDDARRAVDVILGIVASAVGRYDQFVTKLVARQGGTRFGKANIRTVTGTLVLACQGGATKFLPPPVDNGSGANGNQTKPLM